MNNKLLRSELKSIVKECLVEILSEGIKNQNVDEENTYNKNRIKENKNNNFLKSNKRKKSLLRSKKAINTNLTEDPILNEMLADTASSTLAEQIEAESRGGILISKQGDQAAKIVDQSNPEDLFREESDKWASLAFS
jgi:hypothetical protein